MRATSVPPSKPRASAGPALGRGGLGRASKPSGRGANAGSAGYDLAMDDGPVHAPRRPPRRDRQPRLQGQPGRDGRGRAAAASPRRGTGGHEAADLVVVNTCTVTSIADRKSRHAVRRATRTSPAAQVLVTGCSVAVDPEIAGGGRSGGAPLRQRFEGPAAGRAGEPARHPRGADAADPLGRRACGRVGRSLEPVGLEPGEGSVEDTFEREIDRTRAFVKVQDGCSFFCTYCIIPAARGPERSLSPATVLSDVRRALRAGHREIVLTGINIGTYDGDGADPGTRLGLPGLVRRILDETDVERIRLSSIEPQHVTDELLDVWAGSGGALPAPPPPAAAVGRRHDPAPDGPPLRRRVLCGPGGAGAVGRSPELPSTRT